MLPADSELQKSRSLLQAILSRRDFLATTGAVALSASLSSLTACSDGGSPTAPPVTPPVTPPITPPVTPPAGPPVTGPNTTLHVVSGTVTLPPGSTLNPNALFVDALGQYVQVANGSFTVGTPDNGPALAALVDSAGEVVMMSVLDPTATTHNFSAKTTAVAMLGFGAGIWALPAPSMSLALKLLAADPATDSVAATLSTAIAGDPHALANGTASIAPAVMQALRTMLTSTTSNVAPHNATARADGAPALLLLSPSGLQSGIEVNQDSATATSLLISNGRRRPGRAYVYKTSSLTGSTTVTHDPAIQVSGPLSLPPTGSLELFQAIGSIFKRTAPFTPVTLPAVPLTLPAGVDRANHLVVVIGASIQTAGGNTFEPIFYGQAPFAAEVAKWRADAIALVANCIFGEIIFPLVCYVGGIGVVVASYGVIEGVIAEAAAVGNATFKSVMALILAKETDEGLRIALTQTVRDALTSDLLSQFYKPKVKAVVGPAQAAALAAEADFLTQSKVLSRAKAFLKVFEPLLIAGAVLQLADFGVVLSDFVTSNLTESWQAALIRQKLNITPQEPWVGRGERIPFNITAPVSTTLEYEWSNTSLFDTFSANDEVNVGRKITTTKKSVDMLTFGSDIEPVDVLVIGYDSSSGKRLEFGRAGTKVHFQLPAELSPSNPAIEIGSDRLFILRVDGKLPDGVVYKWTLTGIAGSIGGPTNIVTTTVPQINYHGGVRGDDVLKVEVLLGTTIVAKTQTNISVTPPTFIDFDITGTWDPEKTPRNGHYSYTELFSARTAKVDEPGIDTIFIGANVGREGTIGVLLAMQVTSGVAVPTGKTFSKFHFPDSVGSGTWQFLVSKDQANVEASTQYVPGTSGTLKMDDVSVTLDGTTVGRFTFTVSNGAGGLITGRGIGRWKYVTATR